MGWYRIKDTKQDFWTPEPVERQLNTPYKETHNIENQILVSPFFFKILQTLQCYIYRQKWIERAYDEADSNDFSITIYKGSPNSSLTKTHVNIMVKDACGTANWLGCTIIMQNYMQKHPIQVSLRIKKVPTIFTVHVVHKSSLQLWRKWSQLYHTEHETCTTA